MDILVGKKPRPLPEEAWSGLLANASQVLVDIGTGDGSFVLRSAREHPDWLCIGVDPVAEAMAGTSRRAAAKPARGGVGNALFLVASVENLPRELAGVAARVTVNYPWGSLLKALVVPLPPMLSNIAGVARTGARFDFLINLSVFHDAEYRARLGLPDLDIDRVWNELAPLYRGSGLEIEQAELLEDSERARSAWGNRLVLGARREPLAIRGRFLQI